MANRSRRPIEEIFPGDHVLSSYGAGDLRPARVMERYARRREGQIVSLHLASGAVVKSTPDHTHFAGYVLGQTPQTYFLYLMHKVGVGFRLGTSQVYTNGQARPMVGFKQRAVQEHADATWIIRTHATENEARADEMLTSLRFGLPTLPFVPRKGKGANGLVHDPRYIGVIFSSLNTTDAALRLLEDCGLDPDRPHHAPQSRNSNRRNIVITLCGDRRGMNPMHRISVVGIDGADRSVWRGARVENLHKFRATSRRNCSSWSRTTAPPHHPERRQRADRQQHRPHGQEPVDQRRASGEPIRVYAAFNERDEADFVVDAHPRLGRARAARAASAACCTAPTRSRACLEEALIGAHPVPRLRRPAVLRARRDQGRARLPAPDLQPRRRCLVRARREPADARHRRQESLDAMREAARARAARCGSRGGRARSAAGGRLGPKARRRPLHGFLALIERWRARSRACRCTSRSIT
jgi:hypothetical protein